MMTDPHLFAVIMAGGGGTRLWPISRRSRPKQMVRLSGDRTFYQLAVDRLEGILPPERILVVTIAEQAQDLMRACPEIPEENFLIEPGPRGTASVVGLAALAAAQRDPQAVTAVVTADHAIRNVPHFQELLQAGNDAARDHYLVTLGIPPTFPATGYGYIQRGARVGEYRGLPTFEVLRFKEKPDVSTAEDFLARGDHDWNSGMFIWRADQILAEIKRQMPDLSARLSRIEADWHTPDRMTTLNQEWADIRPQTVDYGIMEHAERVVVLPAGDLGWNDVGSWESLYDTLSADENGNLTIGASRMDISSNNTLVASEEGQRLIVTIGVSDLVVVETPDALLICNRNDSQRVKEVVDLLKKQGKEKFL